MRTNQGRADLTSSLLTKHPISHLNQVFAFKVLYKMSWTET